MHFLVKHSTHTNPSLRVTTAALFVIFPMMFFLLGMQYQSLLDSFKPTPPSAIVPTPTPSPRPKADTSDWKKVNFAKCGVTFSIPPKREPYYFPPEAGHASTTDVVGSGAYWDAPRGNIYADILSVATGNRGDQSQMNAMFSTGLGGGFIPGAVSVTCQDNTLGLNRETFLAALRKGVDAYNRLPGEKSMGPETYQIKSATTVTKWGREAELITMVGVSGNVTNSTGSEQYVIVTPARIYQIRTFVQSPNNSVKAAAQEILDSLTIQ